VTRVSQASRPPDAGLVQSEPGHRRAANAPGWLDIQVRLVDLPGAFTEILCGTHARPARFSSFGEERERNVKNHAKSELRLEEVEEVVC